MVWQCLLDGGLANRARDAARDVVASIVTTGPAASHRIDGDCARAVLLAYGTDAGLVDGAPHVDAYLAAAIDSVRSARIPGLWSGVSGTMWTLAHQAELDDVRPLLDLIDDALIRALSTEMWTAEYDLIGGLVGIGVAAIERLRDDPSSTTARLVASQVLRHLEAMAVEDDLGIAWWTPSELLPEWQRATNPAGYFNLGVAHGIPGVIGLLARNVTIDFEVARSRRLLDGAMRWLLAAVPRAEHARFPQWLSRDRRPAPPTRLAWCYGDAGIAVTILAAARAASTPEWEAEARALARGMAARPVDSSGVVDAGICHGASGVAHCFNRLYQATRDSVFADAARSWIERALDLRRVGGPGVDFPSATVVPTGIEWNPDTTLLTGSVGVALVLLAATSDIDPEWDRVLLVDLPTSDP